MIKFYVRLLSYANAMKLIEFVNADKEDYANVVPHGTSVVLAKKSKDQVEDFLKTLDCRYELSEQHPIETHEGIIEALKHVQSMKRGLKTHRVIDRENNESIFVGTEPDCHNFISEQPDSFMYNIAPMTVGEVMDYPDNAPYFAPKTIGL